MAEAWAESSWHEATLLVDVYWLALVSKGRLGIMPRPRGGDWLTDEMRSLAEQGTTVLVSLLEASEIRELLVEQEERACRDVGLEFLSHAIPDRGVPVEWPRVEALIRDLKASVDEGAGVVLHCRQGLGRSATIAAAVLVALGESPERAFARIENARGLAVPDTDEQRAWVGTFTRRVRSGN